MVADAEGLPDERRVGRRVLVLGVAEAGGPGGAGPLVDRVEEEVPAAGVAHPGASALAQERAHALAEGVVARPGLADERVAVAGEVHVVDARREGERVADRRQRAALRTRRVHLPHHPPVPAANDPAGGSQRGVRGRAARLLERPGRVDGEGARSVEGEGLVGQFVRADAVEGDRSAAGAVGEADEGEHGDAEQADEEEAGEEGAHGVGGRDGATGRTRRGCPGRRPIYSQHRRAPAEHGARRPLAPCRRPSPPPAAHSAPWSPPSPAGWRWP